MASCQPVRRNALARAGTARPPRLNRQEWELVLKAVGAYQHNAAFRALSEKLEEALHCSDPLH